MVSMSYVSTHSNDVITLCVPMSYGYRSGVVLAVYTFGNQERQEKSLGQASFYTHCNYTYIISEGV